MVLRIKVTAPAATEPPAWATMFKLPTEAIVSASRIILASSQICEASAQEINLATSKQGKRYSLGVTI